MRFFAIKLIVYMAMHTNCAIWFACLLAISMSLLQRIGYRCSHWLNNSICTVPRYYLAKNEFCVNNYTHYTRD